MSACIVASVLLCAQTLLPSVARVSDCRDLGLIGPVSQLTHKRKDIESGTERLFHTYRFDRRGFLVAEVSFDDGHESQVSTISYEASGVRTLRVIEKDVSALSRNSMSYGSKVPPAPDQHLVFRDTFLLDSSGRVIEETQLRADGSLVRTERYRYDDRGRRSWRASVNAGGEEFGVITFEYTSTDQLLHVRSRGDVIERYSNYRLDKMGNWVERTVETPDYSAPQSPSAARPFTIRTIETREIAYYDRAT